MTERIRSGEMLHITIYSFDAHGNILSVPEDTIPTDKKGGGFFGTTYFADGNLQDESGELLKYVIKDTQPGPVHMAIRDLHRNKEGPFPDQNNLFAAQLDHISMKILHRIIPLATKGEVITPESYGYALTDSGYVQIIQKITNGRIPHLGLESDRLQDIRKKLFKISVIIGSEHGGQIHPDNPRGKPNLWVDKTHPLHSPLIWLDLTPAIEHNGKFLKVFRFPFHHDMKRRFRSKDVTFNRFHTNRLRRYLDRYAADWDPDTVAEIRGYADVYDQVYERYRQVKRAETIADKEAVMSYAMEQGLLQQEDVDIFRKYNRAYKNWVTKVFVKDMFDIAKTIPDKFRGKSIFAQVRDNYKEIFSKEKETRFGTIKVVNVDVIKQKLLINSFMRGYKTALHEGLISQEEYDAALEDIKKRDTKHLLVLQGIYIAQAVAFNLWLADLVFRTPSAPDIATHLAFIGLVDRAFPPITRAITALAVAKLSKKDLTRAFYTTMLPLGSYTAPAAQLATESEEVWYYAKRALIGRLSKVRIVEGGYEMDFAEKADKVINRWAGRISKRLEQLHIKRKYISVDQQNTV